LTIVFGTPVTWYRRARSGYSVASTAYAVTLQFAHAISCASVTALGQCGHVGVEKTCRFIGRSMATIFSRLSFESIDGPPPTSRIALMSEMNS